ncbi:Gas vesicle synthesis protein GvpL/GvpF [Thermomonospora echinospora]|uniref:Gas vesicle synthesis protein GvpL/GvpF n=1 Tax=Thermomonospora echinospora TaxID=1992 RepID=A0A1H6CIW9_9ACTN|nr:GvpL/GvpF family gas vesicle protein [Thermomonospora echinospora]SEG72868.1 Gas vesicle synthesis protein GvpL/GvpF [Thermomonospora echinospora]
MTTSSPQASEAVRDATSTAWYVYGIVPADVETAEEARGVDERAVEVIRYGEIAALVSEVDPQVPLGRPADLLAHQQLLDDAAAEAPVLPMRFGAVLTTEQAVVEDLLAPNHDGFAAALADLEGRVEYVVRGRYVERVILTEVIEENPEAAGLREQIRGLPEEQTRQARVRLGELIYQGIEAKRQADTQKLIQNLAPYCVANAVREPTHQLDAVHVAFLVEDAQRPEFEEAVAKAAGDGKGRADLRLQGPIAPWDFVITPGGGG